MRASGRRLPVAAVILRAQINQQRAMANEDTAAILHDCRSMLGVYSKKCSAWAFDM
jgi:hypothetical protein